MAKAGYRDWIGIERKVANSPAFKSLPPIARALYLDLRRQHNGFNNGQIAAVLQGTPERPGLAAFGWPPRTVYKYVKLLLEHGLIEKTRQGGIGAMSKTCTLYGFTDLAVVANKEKGIQGRLPSLAYLAFRAPEKQVEAACGASIAAHGARTQLHTVPSAPPQAAHGAVAHSLEKTS